MAININDLSRATGTYTPMSYEGMARPIRNEVAGTYLQSQVFEDMKNETDALALSQEEYDTYLKPTMDKVKEASNNLIKNGINNSGGIQAFLKLRKDYIDTVNPIRTAQMARMNGIAQQQAIRSKVSNPNDIIFKRNATDIPFEEWLQNPHMQVTDDLINLDAIRKEANRAASTLANQSFEDGVSYTPVITKGGRVIPGMYNATVRYGISPEELNMYMTTGTYSSEAGKLLDDNVKSMLNSYNINPENGWSQQDANAVRETILSQLPSAVGKSSTQTLKDENYFVDKQRAAAIEENRRNALITYFANQGYYIDENGVPRDVYGNVPEAAAALFAGSEVPEQYTNEYIEENGYDRNVHNSLGGSPYNYTPRANYTPRRNAQTPSSNVQDNSTLKPRQETRSDNENTPHSGTNNNVNNNLNSSSPSTTKQTDKQQGTKQQTVNTPKEQVKDNTKTITKPKSLDPEVYKKAYQAKYNSSKSKSSSKNKSLSISVPSDDGSKVSDVSIEPISIVNYNKASAKAKKILNSIGPDFGKTITSKNADFFKTIFTKQGADLNGKGGIRSLEEILKYSKLKGKELEDFKRMYRDTVKQFKKIGVNDMYTFMNFLETGDADTTTTGILSILLSSTQRGILRNHVIDSINKSNGVIYDMDFDENGKLITKRRGDRMSSDVFEKNKEKYSIDFKVMDSEGGTPYFVITEPNGKDTYLLKMSNMSSILNSINDNINASSFNEELEAAKKTGLRKNTRDIIRARNQARTEAMLQAIVDIYSNNKDSKK